MRNWKVGLGVFVAILVLAGGLSGCKQRAEEPAKGRPATEAPPPEPLVVNAACPMMGTVIDPANVPDSLIREFEGKKVGFCCAGCPVAWDKLSDEDKRRKLAGVEASKPG